MAGKPSITAKRGHEPSKDIHGNANAKHGVGTGKPANVKTRPKVK